jgi:hypothetical protein
MASARIVDRANWLGYRWAGHGLDGGISPAGLDDLLLLGFQDSRQGGAGQALIQRTRTIGTTPVARAISPEGPLVSMWSVRGAPHAHRITQLDVVRDALRPQDAEDGGAGDAAAVDEVAAALRAIVTAPMSKPAASTEVTRRVRDGLATWCERCQSTHVPDALFRAAGRQAQLALGPDEQRSTMLHPAPAHPPATVPGPRGELLRAFLRVNGPVSRTQFRDWMDASTRATAELWETLGDELVRVQVDGKRMDLPAPLLDAVTGAPAPRGVALVPPNDPYLRQVDRTLLMPGSSLRHQVFRPLSGPGALLVDGEVGGTWRYRRGNQDVTIMPFDRLAPAHREQAEHRARLVAAAAGDDEPRVTWD